jgi:predicted FMN-binding regulatory protein PaiB
VNAHDHIFAPPSERDVTRLVLEFPFAWVVTAAEDDFAATPLPIRPVLDAGDRVTALVGHFARANPQVELLRRHPRALVLFMGPQGYISASWMRDRTRTPTWNYAMVQYVVDIELVEDEARTDALMRDLVDAMETGRENPWSIEDMGGRYRSLAAGVVAFHAHLRERRARFKLAQDERSTEYADILRALGDGGQDTLRAWVEEANLGRTCQVEALDAGWEARREPPED